MTGESSPTSVAGKKKGAPSSTGSRLSTAVFLCVGLLIGFEISPFSPFSLEKLETQSRFRPTPVDGVPLNCSTTVLEEEKGAIQGLLPGFPQKSCKETLDALDQTHNRRRAARQEVVQSKGGATYDPRKKVYFDLYEAEAVCLTEERGGTDDRYKAMGDGPKFLCGVDYIASDENNDCLVYSIGSNNEIEFERFAKNVLKCNVFTFDPTLRTAFLGTEYADFRPWGFGAQGANVTVDRGNLGTFNFTSHSIEGAMALLNHTGTKIDILKMDCEGCEYEAVTEAFRAIAAGRLEIDQVQVELHRLGPFSDVYTLFEAADDAKMRIFHKEGNHWGCSGFGCVEYAFISESFLRRATAHALSCPLDS